MSALRSAENSCSTTARRETTTLLRFWSSLMTLNSSGLPSRYEVSRTGRTSTSEPGRKARTFSISTVKPPLTRPVMTPVTISDLLKASSRRVQVRARLAFSRERRVSPVPSSTESSATSTWSPDLTSTSPRSFLNCSRGMTASDFSPTLTMTTSLVTSTMSPVRIMPGRMRWLARLCSKSWAKLSVIPSLVARIRRVCTGTASGAAQENVTSTCVLRVPSSDFLDSLGVRDERPSGPQATSGSQLQHPLHHLLDRKAGRVDDTGVGRGLQRGDLTGLIPQIPLGYLARKGGKANIRTLVFQLLMSPQSPLLGGGGQEYFQLRPGEHHGPHIPAVCHQSGGGGKGPLACEQGLTDRGPRRHARGALSRLLRANISRHVPPREGDALTTVRGNREDHIHARRECRMAWLIVRPETRGGSGERHQPIESAAIE